MTFSQRLFLILYSILACAVSLIAQSPDATKILPTFVVQDVGSKFNLIAYGDIRFTDPDSDARSNPEVRRAVVQKIAEERPGALLITGDIPYRGGKQSDWEVADAELKPLWDAKIRIYPALGNHELADGEAAGLKNWWKRFPQLDQKR